MYLTRKQLGIIWAITGVYMAIGMVSLAFFFLFLPYSEIPLLIIGLLMPLLSIAVYKWGRFALGKGRLLSKGNKLLNHQLRSAECLRLYEKVRDNPDNVVAEPDVDVLNLVAVAYVSLQQIDNALDVLDLMMTVAPEKKRPLIKILRASLLYTNGDLNEAEVLYTELANSRLDAMAAFVFNALKDGDRALATGDFVTAEGYFNRLITQQFPKPTPLMLVESHFDLATLYMKTDRMAEAKPHLAYCAKNGGETAFRTEAEKLLASYAAE